MRDGKRLDGDVADRKFRAGSEEAPVAMFARAAAATDRFRRQRVAINRDREISGKALPGRRRDRHVRG